VPDGVGAGIPAGTRASVGAALSGCGDDRRGAAGAPGAAVAGIDDPSPVTAAAMGVPGPCPPAALVLRAAHPAVKVTAVSAAAHANALACQARRLPFPRLPRPACPPNLTRDLPAHVLSYRETGGGTGR
jgi:hypothetical protein